MLSSETTCEAGVNYSLSSLLPKWKRKILAQWFPNFLGWRPTCTGLVPGMTHLYTRLVISAQAWYQMLTVTLQSITGNHQRLLLGHAEQPFPLVTTNCTLGGAQFGKHCPSAFKFCTVSCWLTWKKFSVGSQKALSDASSMHPVTVPLSVDRGGREEGRGRRGVDLGLKVPYPS